MFFQSTKGSDASFDSNYLEKDSERSGIKSRKNPREVSGNMESFWEMSGNFLNTARPRQEISGISIHEEKIFLTPYHVI